MIKKLIAFSLVISILCSSLFGTVKTAEASLPDAAIKLSRSALAALINLIAAGLDVGGIISAEDIGRKYSETGYTHPQWDAEGNLTIDVQAIDNARDWLDATYPGMPAIIQVDRGTSFIGAVLPAITPYTRTATERTIFHDQNFSSNGLREINILDFGAITTWMGYDPDYLGELNDATITISDAETGAFYQMDMSSYYGYFHWIGGGMTYHWLPYDYIGMIDQMKICVSTRDSTDTPGEKELIVWPSFHDLDSGWTDYDQVPNVVFGSTDATHIKLTLTASPMNAIQTNIYERLEYPKTEFSFNPKRTEPVVVKEPTNWNQIGPTLFDPDEPPPDPLPTDELGFLTSIWTQFKNLFTWLQSLPNLMAEAMKTNLIALFVPLDLTPLKTDFQAVNDAFASAFPFSIASDLNGLFFPPDGGLQYPAIGYTMTDPDQVSRYHVVFDFGDVPSGHKAMSDQLRHILTLALWLGFAVGLLSMFLKRGGKIS